jgi:hypothetical protein
MLSVECHDYLNVMLSVVRLNVVMLNVVMLNVVMLNAVMLNVVMLNVVMLNVVASFEKTKNKDKYRRRERKTERAK